MSPQILKWSVNIEKQIFQKADNSPVVRVQPAQPPESHKDAFVGMARELVKLNELTLKRLEHSGTKDKWNKISELDKAIYLRSCMEVNGDVPDKPSPLMQKI
mmetsp:Transcript_26934/g.32663  ORF Transcript_26934/g.32663 Transcript_26934/m.32663 type:complete len:102 (-) Transcript_26934:273-578(-)